MDRSRTPANGPAGLADDEAVLGRVSTMRRPLIGLLVVGALVLAGAVASSVAADARVSPSRPLQRVSYIVQVESGPMSASSPWITIRAGRTFTAHPARLPYRWATRQPAGGSMTVVNTGPDVLMCAIQVNGGPYASFNADIEPGQTGSCPSRWGDS